MARVMIIGYGPLPGPGQSYMAAPSLRTRHFLKPILERGHTVNLYTLPTRTPPGPEGERSAMMPDNYEGLVYQRFSNHDTEFATQMLTEQARQIAPDAIVGVNTMPAFVAATLPVRVPLWADLNGYWMAEMQGKAHIEGDDVWLSRAWAVERTIARRLDKFSAVTRAQLSAVLGEMAAVGRLNQYTFDYPFGHPIPNGSYEWEPMAGEPADPVLRGPLVPSDAFIVLWSGGFNVWADVQTLADAMDRLMEQYPVVHFVATGGRIEGHVTRPYEEFEERVEASPHKHRYHLMGWVESEKLARIYAEADLGISVDSRNYETFFGARNRINAMAAAGLAVVTTLGTEISEWLADGNAVRRIMRSDFSYARTTRRLLAWLERPQFAPDNIVKLQRGGEGLQDLLSIALNPLEEEAMLMARHGVEGVRQALEQASAPQSGLSRLFGGKRG